MIDVNAVTTKRDFALCLSVRFRVFIIEQHVPIDREIDGFEDVCRHYLATANGRAVGTARWRIIGEGTGKIERVAVLADARRSGVGAALMARVIDDIGNEPQIKGIKASAQIRSIPFYRRLGFTAVGPEYLDANIPHRDIVLEF